MCSLYLGENLISGSKPINLGVRNIGEIVASSLPLTDAGLHLLDGSRLSGDGIYKGFVDYIADLYNDTKVYNPSAFTVVGSPNITDDGIASGFSNSNYLRRAINITPSNKLIIKSRIVYNTLGNSSSYPQAKVFCGTNYNGWRLLTNFDNTIQFVSNDLGKVSLNIGTLTDGDIIDTELIITQTNVTINAIKNGIKYTKTESKTVTFGNITSIVLGDTFDGSAYYFTGSIDLKQFSITVDGKEVFSGSKPAKYFTTESAWQSSVSTYGSCGKFVYDSTNNTVRLPKVSDILQGTTDVSALGDLVEAGLPVHTHTRGTMNITGKSSAVEAELGGTGGSGALYNTWSFNGYAGGAKDGRQYVQVNMDASRSWTGNTSNPIYTNNIQNSSTVQPQTIKAFYYIVIANSTKTEIQVDIDEVATDLNGKADTDLTNTTDQAKILMGGMAMPSDKYINLTLGASGATYTAPADGWFYVHGNSSANTNFHSITIFYNSVNNWDTPVVRVCHNAPGAGTADLVPVKKGQTIRIEFSEMTMQHVVFVYAQGSESEA